MTGGFEAGEPYFYISFIPTGWLGILQEVILSKAKDLVVAKENLPRSAEHLEDSMCRAVPPKGQYIA